MTVTKLPTAENPRKNRDTAEDGAQRTARVIALPDRDCPKSVHCNTAPAARMGWRDMRFGP